MKDPTSHVAAAVSGWQLPMSHEALALADVFDSLEFKRIRRKHKPRPRPWDEPPKKHGTGARTVDDWKRFKERKLLDFRRRRGDG
jgi:hypothetical protein